MKNSGDKIMNQEMLNELIQCSQSLWNEGSIRGLLKRFVSVLHDKFDTKRVAAYSLIKQGHAYSLIPENIRFSNVKMLEKNGLASLAEQLATISWNDAEYQEGLHHLFVEGDDIAFFTIGDQSGEWFVLAWRFQSCLEKNPESAKQLLEFLVNQVQSEGSWFRRLDKAQALLYRDDLTGLFNHRYLDIAIDSEIRRAQRFQAPFCVLFMDIDQFKQVNDQFGHLVGSRILKQVAAELKDDLREVDSIIRYGGDEYIAILLGATAHSGRMAAERIRHRVEAKEFVGEDGKTIRLTLSIGVTAFPEHGHDKETLLRVADECMYKSKRLGRNRVTVASIHSTNKSEMVPASRFIRKD